MVTVELEGVTVQKDGVEALRGVDLTVDAGTVVALIGTTGSGKTSVLRAVTGLDEITSGTIRFDGVDVSRTPPASRDVAFVFQRPALYPHRTVGGNIAFPLELRKAHADEIRSRVGAEARALHVESLLTRSPGKLSAGEAQAVQIARALVKQPAVLLLDEPFAHFDSLRVEQLRRELLVIQRGFEVTTIVALSDSTDALAMADRLAVIERGRIVQIGEPVEVYRHPRTAAAALLTGDADVVEVGVTHDGDGSWLVRPGLRIRAWQPALRAHQGRRLQMVVRPEWWSRDEHGAIVARIERVRRLGTATSLWCRVGGEPLTVTLAGSAHGSLREGDEIRLRLEHYVLLDPLHGYELDLGRDP